MSNSLQLEIVTPEGRVLSATVEAVVLPGSEGELGVLPEHAPMLVQLKPGALRVTRSTEALVFVIGGGLAEITGSYVRVLAEMAANADHLDEQTAAEIMELAHETRRPLSQAEIEEIAATIALIKNTTSQIHAPHRHHLPGKSSPGEDPLMRP